MLPKTKNSDTAFMLSIVSSCTVNWYYSKYRMCVLLDHRWSNKIHNDERNFVISVLDSLSEVGPHIPSITRILVYWVGRALTSRCWEIFDMNIMITKIDLFLSLNSLYLLPDMD
jgi:hypothetical protein